MASALLVAGLGVPGPGLGVAAAAPDAGTAQTAACRSDQPRVRHLVLFAAGTGVDAAKAEIGRACGSLTGYYPEIAVAVATSPDSRFADRIGRDRAYSAQAEALTGTERPAGRPHAVGVQSVSAFTGFTSEANESGEADRTGEQWGMDLIHADEARSIQDGDDDVLVGVLDSGVDADHPDLAAAIDRSASAGCVTGVPDTSARAWRPSGDHGTHVAGIIAAADDGAGITGVAPGVRIAAVKVVDSGGFIYPESALCGFMWAARNDMRITNNSYFVDPWLFTCSDEPGQAVVYEALRRAVGFATERGVLTVAAVGNENHDLAGPVTDQGSPNNAREPRPRPVDNDCAVLPAELPDVLAVSAVGADGVKSSYSSYGLGVVDVTAPGGDIRQRSPSANSGCVLSTVRDGYGRMCGTSMAAPHATGVAALVASAHPDLGAAELARIVTSTAKPVACPDGRYDPDSNGRADASCDTAAPQAATDTTASAVDPAAGGTAAAGGRPGTGPVAANGFYGAGLVDAAAALTPRG